MKKILSIFLALFVLSAGVFAETEGDDYDDGYIYETNGAGDQFLKVNLGGLFPLNFNGQLYTGGCADLGYFRYINKLIAVGGEFSVTYNVSVGRKMYVMIPMTFGALIQPTIGKFEFPLTLTAGLGYETFQGRNYFPSPAVKGSAGAYYRLSDACSLGVTSSALWIPQWSSKGYHQGLFLSACISARYHF